MRVATLEVYVHRDKQGDFELKFPAVPNIDTDSQYEFVKLSLLAGELAEFMKQQCTVVNIDLDGKIKRLAELLIDDEGWKMACEQRKALADVDKYQTKLPGFEVETTE